MRPRRCIVSPTSLALFRRVGHPRTGKRRRHHYGEERVAMLPAQGSSLIHKAAGIANDATRHVCMPPGWPASTETVDVRQAAGVRRHRCSTPDELPDDTVPIAGRRCGSTWQVDDHHVRHAGRDGPPPSRIRVCVAGAATTTPSRTAPSTWPAPSRAGRPRSS
jgi:hypothetical protein